MTSDRGGRVSRSGAVVGSENARLRVAETGEWERPEGPSDLGRRLVERRTILGLSTAQVAARAAMDPGYLDYLEKAPAPGPTRSALVRLAVVLETSVAALQGADLQSPSGRESTRSPARLHELSTEECRALIAPGGVGRFVYLEGRGPVAVPVNFRMLGGDVVFRTATANSLAQRAGQIRVSFEVDHLDDALEEGWSVLLSGRAHPVTDPADLAEIDRLGVRPWAAGRRDRCLRLVPEEISGRRIRAVND